MLIRFIKPVELEVTVGMKDDEPITENELFLAGEQTTIDICDSMVPPFAREIQFGDGVVAFVTPDFWAAVEIKM